MALFSERHHFFRRNLGLRERESMPLLSYFVAVGAALTALLLMLNVLLERPEPHDHHHLTRSEKDGAILRATTGSAQQPSAMPGPVLGIQAGVPEPTAASPTEPPQQHPPTADQVKQKRLAPAKPKNRSGQNRTKGRNSDDALRLNEVSRSRYLLEGSRLQASPEGTLGPH
jgi:hypothetical protein